MVDQTGVAMAESKAVGSVGKKVAARVASKAAWKADKLVDN